MEGKKGGFQFGPDRDFFGLDLARSQVYCHGYLQGAHSQKVVLLDGQQTVKQKEDEYWGCED